MLVETVQLEPEAADSPAFGVEPGENAFGRLGIVPPLGQLIDLALQPPTQPEALSGARP